MSTDNIVPFRAIVSALPADAPPPAPTLPEGMTQEQAEMVKSIADFVQFMLDNKMNVKHFVCSVALTDEEHPAEYNAVYHTITSSIQVRDYALALKMLENSFYQNLNKGNFS